jgi:hypothetical protein
VVSKQERQRFALLFEKAQGAMDRQKRIINRLAAANMETVAALTEIASDESDINNIRQARKRAQEALDRLERMAAALVESAEESSVETTQKGTGEASDPTQD